MSVINVNINKFEELINDDRNVLLDFYADWCVPCRMISPIVEEIAEENPQYVVGKINVDDTPELAQKFGVASIPTLVVMKNGEVTGKAVGTKSKAQILKMLEG